MKNLTIQQAIDDIINQLEQSDLHYGHGTDNAWDEAAALVLQTLQVPFSASEKELQRSLTQAEQNKLLFLLKKRIEDRIPLAYLTKEAYFFGLPFYVDERVIIPRSSIAELIEVQFSPWANPEKVTRILDLCTGSGCIAIACATAFEYAVVDAVDLSEDALDVAKINVEKHAMQKQVNLIKSDLFNSLEKKRYDIIVSNPPYVSREEINTLPAEYKHEPDMAFYSADNGLELTIRILQQAADYLTDDGVLVVEVGNSDEALQERFPQVPFLWLEFEYGEGGVFLLTAEQLRECQSYF